MPPQLKFMAMHAQVGVPMQAAGSAMHVPVIGAIPTSNAPQNWPAPHPGPPLPIAHRRVAASGDAGDASTAAGAPVLE
jgi:hypothetical protein